MRIMGCSITRNKLLLNSLFNLKVVDYKVKFAPGIVMRRYFVDKKCLFIHIPKAAGKSVGLALFDDDCPGHFMYRNYRNADPRFFKNAFKFSFVRHPVKRFISAYRYLKSGGGSDTDLLFSREVLTKYSDINDFVENWLNVNTANSWIHFIPQHYFIFEKDKLMLDFLGRFENLESDFKTISLRIGASAKLPHVNKSATTTQDCVCLTDNSRVILENIYERDFELLGYSKT